MAAAITAVMCGDAYAQSARIAERLGAFPCYAVNREPMLDVIRMHRDSCVPSSLKTCRRRCSPRRRESWDDALDARRKVRLQEFAGHRAGADWHHRIHDGLRYDRHRARPRAGETKKAGRRRRNQDRQQHRSAGADAPGLLAGADLANRFAYRSQGRSRARRDSSRNTCRYLIARLLRRGGRSIAWRGHLNMMAAVQPFLSGAISKTINMPEESTVEDIMHAYIESWKLGLKAVAIYRDNSKRSQPLSAAGKKEARNLKVDRSGQGDAKAEAVGTVHHAAASAVAADSSELFTHRARRKLPSERQLHHPQILRWRARGLHHGRYVRRRYARRNLHQDGQGRLDAIRLHGWFRAFGIHWLAIRRPVEGAGRQVHQLALRAFGLYRASVNPLCEIRA